MKVTALIPDNLINSVRALSGGKNTTEALITALRDWVAIKELSSLRSDLIKKPLKFSRGDVASKLRLLNRKYNGNS